MDKPVEKVPLAAESRVFADPANLPADGVVGVRTLLPEDHQRLRAMFSRLSSQSIYRRFHTPYPRVPEWMTEFLMDADRRGGRSLVAVVGEEIVGHAMCTRPEVGVAEIAMVVEDRWQHRGIGKLLLFTLAVEARRRGIETFISAVLGENRSKLNLIRAVFAEVKYQIREDTYLVRAPLRSLKPTYKTEVPSASMERELRREG